MAGTYACFGISGWTAIRVEQLHPHAWPHFWYLGVLAGVAPISWRNKTVTPGQNTAYYLAATPAILWVMIILFKGNIGTLSG